MDQDRIQHKHSPVSRAQTQSMADDELTDRHRVRRKLGFLLSSFMIGFLLLCGLAYETLRTVKINGPLYGFIQEKNAVIADVLPPPQYVVESYLVALQLIDEPNAATRTELLTHLQQLQISYQTRHNHWSTTLTDGPLRTALMVDSHTAAAEFYHQIESAFLPALARDDKQTARAIAVGPLKDRFKQHRHYINRVVNLAATQSSNAELEASQFIDHRSRILIILAATISLPLLGLGLVLSRRILSASQALEREVAERKRAEHDLRESETLRREALRRSNELQSALLASISHDLRSPLASIDGSARLVSDSDSPEERQYHLGQIHTKCASMLTLVNDLLDMLRLEAGGLKPQCEWQYFDEVIDTAVENMKNLLNGRRIKVLHVTPDPPPLFIDGVLMLQVLTNLIDNAAKYSFPNSVIEIDMRIAEQTVEVAVSNEGEKIPTEQWNEMFRPFYRHVRTHLDAKINGTGLGLAICKGIVEAHDGQIWIRQIPGGKTSFLFSLPILERAPSILELQPQTVAPFHFSAPMEQT